MLALTRRDRRRCAWIGALFGCAAYALAPLAGQTASEAGRADRILIAPRQTVTALEETKVELGPVADPFARTLEEAGGNADRSSSAQARKTPRFSQTSALILRAVVVGPRTYALVEDNGVSRIVSAGDAVGSTHVTSIEQHGLALHDGRHLTLEGSPR